MPDPQRGEVWWVNWSPGRGSEQSGRRPAVVIQTDPANKNSRYPNTIVAAISTKGKPFPFHILLTPTSQNGLTEESFVKCEQIMTIDKARLGRRIGLLSDIDMNRVDIGVKIVLSLR